jgi:hypothetical protein
MNLLKNKKALSTVVTTLIILVVSVLLATVVTFYAINVTTTRVQEESMQVFKLHNWHNGTTFAEAALLVVNTGGRDVVLDKITVRGQNVPWANVYWNKTSDTINVDLTYVIPNADGTLTGTNVTLNSVPYLLSAATDHMTLKSGDSVIIYIANPDHVSVNDIGVTIGVTIFTANAQYYKEANVEAAT